MLQVICLFLIQRTLLLLTESFYNIDLKVLPRIEGLNVHYYLPNWSDLQGASILLETTYTSPVVSCCKCLRILCMFWANNNRYNRLEGIFHNRYIYTCCVMMEVCWIASTPARVEEKWHNCLLRVMQIFLFSALNLFFMLFSDVVQSIFFMNKFFAAFMAFYNCVVVDVSCMTN